VQSGSVPGQDTETFLAAFAYLEEALQPPDLEDALADQDAHLEYAPPLHTTVGGLGCVAVDALAEDDVGLFVFDLGEEL
jgi:D-alanine-D-alanine ligase-like ATP-grasp enzyme